MNIYTQPKHNGINYSNRVGLISLVYPSDNTSGMYEIYSFNELFEDFERYETFEEAEQRCIKLLLEIL